MSNLPSAPQISFQNELNYDVVVYDSSAVKGDKNYFGKLTQLGKVCANTTSAVQSLYVTATLIVTDVAGKPLSRFIVFNPSTVSLKVTAEDEAAMAATFQFIAAIAQDPKSAMAASFAALFKNSSTLTIVNGVNQFFAQQKGYEKCTFQTYMMGLATAAKTPESAHKPADDPTITYSLSTLVARLGGTWPDGMPDITVSDFICTDEEDTFDLWFKLKLSNLPTNGSNILPNFMQLIAPAFPSLPHDVLVKLKFSYEANLGFLSTRLILFLSDHDIPVNKPALASLNLAVGDTTLTIQQPEIIIDINPLFKFIVFTLKGILPFTIFGTKLDAFAALTVDNIEAHVGLVIQGDHTSLSPLPIMTGVHFDQFGVGLGIFFEPPSYSVGVQGKFHIGEPGDNTLPVLNDDTFVVVCSIEEEAPHPIYASFYVPQMNLDKVMEVFTNSTPNLNVPVQFTDLSFKWAEKPMKPVVLPDGTLSNISYGFSAGVNICSFGFYGNVNIDIQNALTADMEMSPLSFNDVFKFAGDGQGVTIKVDANGNPIKNNQLPQICKTKEFQLVMAAAQDKQLVSPGGSVLHIRTLEPPFLHINAKVSLLELVDYEITANIDSSGVSFDLDFGGILTEKMSCTLMDYHNFDGRFKFGIDRSISLPTVAGFSLGSIHLQAAMNAHLAITTSTDDVTFSVGGSFNFAGLDRNFGDFALDLSIKSMEHVVEAIAANIEQNAKDIFSDLLNTAEVWVNRVKSGVITGVTTVAQGLKDAYGKTADEAATILKGAGYAANDVANGLKDVYGLTAEGAATVLKGAGYTVDEVANGLKDAYDLTAEGVAAALKSAGYAVDEVGNALKNVYNLGADGIASAMKGAGYTVNEVGNFLKNAGGFADDAINNALSSAGYAVDDVKTFMKNVFGGKWLPHIDTNAAHVDTRTPHVDEHVDNLFDNHVDTGGSHIDEGGHIDKSG